MQSGPRRKAFENNSSLSRLVCRCRLGALALPAQTLADRADQSAGQEQNHELPALRDEDTVKLWTGAGDNSMHRGRTSRPRAIPAPTAQIGAENDRHRKKDEGRLSSRGPICTRTTRSAARTPRPKNIAASARSPSVRRMSRWSCVNLPHRCGARRFPPLRSGPSQ